jgi:hypothetical protein
MDLFFKILSQEFFILSIGPFDLKQRGFHFEHGGFQLQTHLESKNLKLGVNECP